ncbi:O-Antigen ligase [Posidoniimonas polymericola]|uniref:O-Antigen ligase n=1 Tax=Posidoniimonas polymericola TaxID=2528002 RepID=A0A5C5YSA8_9BACT|nr:O-antigen ligase family protein [Posidoniimonas polymericola]TWT77788.1 O-Antigen ligase [Posidoniimonas polymericola]
MKPQAIIQRLRNVDVRRWPLKAVDAGLAAVLLVAPLFYGGRHDIGLLAYAVIVLATAVAWAVHRATNEGSASPLSGWAAALLAAGPALLLLQLTPLPPAVLGVLSPELADRLTTWRGDANSFGAWQTLTVDAWATRSSLATLLTHCVLFLVAAQRLKTVGDVRRLISWVGFAAVGMSALALLQYASGTKLLLWCIPLPYRDVSRAALGSFTTPNHCGHFIALGVGALLLLALRQREALAAAALRRSPNAKPGVSRDELIRTIGSIAALGLTAAAVLLTFSRGALLAYLVGMAVTLALLGWAGWVGRSHLVRGGLLLIVAGVALSLLQYDQVSQKSGGVTLTGIDDLTDTTDRQLVWRANLSAFAANPVFGYGAGSHGQVYPMFIEEATPVHFTHAESGYLQVATEAGLAGLLLAGGAVALVGCWCVRGLVGAKDRDDLALWAVIAGALGVSLFHSIADFVWFIPSCLAPMVLIAAAAMRLHLLRDKRPLWRPNGVVSGGYAGVAMASACVALLVAPAETARLRDHYTTTSVAVNRYNSSLFAKARNNAPDADDQILASRVYYSDEMIRDLVEIVRANPQDAAAQLRLAAQCLHRFELAQAQAGGGMGLEAVRSAVLASEFPSHEATVEWLRRAFGEDARLLLTARSAAAHAVRLCPLQGEGYLYLADLDFLAADQLPGNDQLVEQALSVRPQNGSVLFTAGKHRFQTAQIDEARELWRRAGRAPGNHLVKLASVVSLLFPAEQFVTDFDPDWRFTFAAYEFYRHRGNETDLRALAVHATKLAEQNQLTDTPRHAAVNYWQAATIHEQLGDLPRAVECAARAYEIEPRLFHIRRGLASALFRSERYDEADPHIRWCLARSPDDQSLRSWLEKIAKHRLMQRDASSPTRVARRSLLASPWDEPPTDPKQDP